MNIKSTETKIRKFIETVPESLKTLPEEELSFKPNPDKWSKKELLGHLCDSAINNLSRFIKAQFEAIPFAVNTYDQDEWVKAAHYNDMTLNEVLSFWEAANRNIINVISSYTPEMLQYECFLDGGDFGNYTKEEIPEYTAPNGMRTLRWLIDDYTAHMEYHLKQIPGLL